MNQHEPNFKIYKLKKRAKLASGKIKSYSVFALRWKCPDTGNKKQQSFSERPLAEEARRALISKIEGKRYFNPDANPSVRDAVEHWMQNKQPQIKAQTFKTYQSHMIKIVGPLLQGTAQERAHFAMTGEKPHRDAKLLLMLGDYKVSELTTAQLRAWHNMLIEEVGHYTANEVMGMFKSILELAQEDFDIPVCKIPTNLARRKHKPRKTILTTEEIGKLMEYAQSDKERGIFVAFPFLTGCRASEQLGLLWEDIDLERNVITICRVLERDGTTTMQTKTDAGAREIPIMPTLRKMLLEWKLLCPRLNGELYRVFAGPGVARAWPQLPLNPGGAILYSNFRRRYWAPTFAQAGVPYVTHHSARHSFVSTLQAQGVEVGLVAKLAGHANPSVTLGHYTQAVRGGEDALRRLDEAYRTHPEPRTGVSA